MASSDERRPAKWYVPWLLIGPGVLWLVFFFVIPLVSLGRTSLENEGFANYTNAFGDQSDIVLRTFVYAFACTILCLAIGYPLAYFIAMRGGKRKNLLLALVVLPFFTTYLIRTIAWVVLLRNDGPVVSVVDTLGLTGLFKAIGLMGAEGQVFGRAPAVVGALTYNFLPFMMLPIYVSLEKIDRKLLEAGPDLYATGARTFRRVTLPLSLPGVFGGSLLTFIPATGDFINSTLLGSLRTTMIGNIIESNFLKPALRPESSALSFVLMALILIGVLIYARLLGTEDLL
jgi:spermidine/putrescine transport system permease protein